MPRIKLSSKLMMVVVTCVVKSDMFVDRLRIIFVFLLSFRMPYRKRDQISRSYSLSWMWIQNHVQEKNKKKYPFLNKHQTCQYIYDLPVQSRIEAAIKDTQLRSHCSWYLPFTLPKLFCNVFFCGIVQFEANFEREREKTSSTTHMSTSFLQLTQVLSSWF